MFETNAKKKKQIGIWWSRTLHMWFVRDFNCKSKCISKMTFGWSKRFFGGEISVFVLVFLSSTLGKIISSFFPSKILSSQLQRPFKIRKTEIKNHGQMLSNCYTTIFRPFHIVQIRIWSSSAKPNTKQKPNTPSQW